MIVMDKETYKENSRLFLGELESLSKKYGVKIYGCGCCESPSVEPIKDDEFTDKHGYNYTEYMGGICFIKWGVKKV